MRKYFVLLFLFSLFSSLSYGEIYLKAQLFYQNTKLVNYQETALSNYQFNNGKAINYGLLTGVQFAFVQPLSEQTNLAIGPFIDFGIGKYYNLPHGFQVPFSLFNRTGLDFKLKTTWKDSFLAHYVRFGLGIQTEYLPWEYQYTLPPINYDQKYKELVMSQFYYLLAGLSYQKNPKYGFFLEGGLQYGSLSSYIYDTNIVEGSPKKSFWGFLINLGITFQLK